MLVPKSELRRMISNLLYVFDSEEIHSIIELEGKAGLEHKIDEREIISISATEGKEGSRDCVVSYRAGVIFPISMTFDLKSNRVTYGIKCSEKISGYNYHPTDFFGNILQSKVLDKASVFQVREELGDLIKL